MKSRAAIFDWKLNTAILLIVVMDIAMMIFGPRDSLDVKFYYTGDQARALLESFDNLELKKYFINEIFDLGLVLSYTGALYIGMRRAYPKKRGAMILAMLPGLCDLVETSFILYALWQPGLHIFFNWLGIVTLLKWLLGGLVILFFAYGAMKERRRYD